MSPLVLVAEDSATARAALRMHLVAQGYAVVEAEDGEQAVEVARRERPDVILLDVEMPVLDGHQVLALLQADESLCDVPVVFLTGRTESDDMVAGLHAGAHDYLRKPFEIPELVARVSAAVRVKHLQDELRRRNEELDYVSRLDSMTGLWNRRHMEERLEAVCGAARRHGFSVSVLLIDLDHFKEVNDRFGHAAGDAVLRMAGEELQCLMRAEDLAGRWGGEEFVVVSPYVSLDGAVTLAERIRTSLAERPVDLGDEATVSVTASAGVCTAHGEAAVPANLLAAADGALYEAKAGGRNRVVSAQCR